MKRLINTIDVPSSFRDHRYRRLRKSNIATRLIRGVSLLLKESWHLERFIWRTSKLAKTIVFYAEHDGYYPCFQSIIDRLVSKYNQTICYITSDPDDPIFKRNEPRVKTYYLNRLLPFFMIIVNCRVFVMTLTDLNQFHLKRSINPVRYVYVFHAMVSTHMMYRYGAFDHYDHILCVGPHHINEIRRHEELNGLRPKDLVEAGYTRLELVYEAYQQYSSRKLQLSRKKIVLIAPSWGPDNVLESCGEGLVELLRGAGYVVIVRPHPETVKRCPGLLASMAYRFGNDPDFVLETSVATHDSLLEADVLICDCSGVALEYAFGTERPVLFLDVPVKVQNRRFKELGIEPIELSVRDEIGVIVPVEELDKVPRVISRLIADSMNYKTRIIELRNRYVYCFGHSAEVSAKCIMNLTSESAHR